MKISDAELLFDAAMQADTVQDAVRARYERALVALTDSLRRDRTILAAILCGSLAHDEVWEKSDIDLLLIGDESYKQNRSFTLTEEEISIHAGLMPRSDFRKAVEGGLQSSFFHSYFSKSRLLYTHDESLRALYEENWRIGAHDRSVQLLQATAMALWALPKAEKWLRVKHDCHYSFVYILHCVDSLAKIEMVSRSEITGREVIHQALRANPEFFHSVYTELIDGPKDEAAIGAALAAVENYLTSRVRLLFGPILNYLAEAGGPRGTTEIDAHFHVWTLGAGGAGYACEWLADQGFIDRVALPIRLNEKSRVSVNEAAYYYDGQSEEK